MTAPTLTYPHAGKVDPEETCPTGSSALSGMIFNPAGSAFPAEFDGALFFADYARGCIWAMERGTNGVPSPSAVRWFRAGASVPVDIQFGPGGDLFYVDVLAQGSSESTTRPATRRRRPWRWRAPPAATCPCR